MLLWSNLTKLLIRALVIKPYGPHALLQCLEMLDLSSGYCRLIQPIDIMVTPIQAVVGRLVILRDHFASSWTVTTVCHMPRLPR